MTSQPRPLARQLAADHRPELSVERSQALDKLHGPSHAWDVSGLYESKFGVSVGESRGGSGEGKGADRARPGRSQRRRAMGLGLGFRTARQDGDTWRL